MNGHRASYKEVIKSAASNTLNELDTSGDLFVLGLHLFFDHGLNDPSAFDKGLGKLRQHLANIWPTLLAANNVGAVCAGF